MSGLRNLVLKPEDLSMAQIDEWDRLAAVSQSPDPQSCGPVWQLTSFAHSDRRHLPIIFSQTETSQIAFCAEKSDQGWYLSPLESHSQFGTPLLGPDSGELLIEALTELCGGSEICRMLIDVPGVCPESQLFRDLDTRTDIISILALDASAAASLEGGVDGWLARRSANFRKKLRQARQQAKNEGVVFERAQPMGADAATALYERMLDVERRSWKGRLQGGLLEFMEFYRDLLVFHARRGSATVVVAVKEDLDIGFCFGAQSHGVYRGQQTSYDSEFGHLSLGAQMHAETAEWLSDLGTQIQHFGPLQHMTPYKRNFCEIEIESVAAICSPT